MVCASLRLVTYDLCVAWAPPLQITLAFHATYRRQTKSWKRMITSVVFTGVKEQSIEIQLSKRTSHENLKFCVITVLVKVVESYYRGRRTDAYDFQRFKPRIARKD
mmetsp:Transcript_21456/g.59646  ORF Transcript_21456/g.59646 Transcript_21456/m.59646 type:complete len:106 (-) Transcript_21456:3872-4189(-)